MREAPSTAERRRPRRLRALSLVAAVVVVLITALPGIASAAPRNRLDPVVNCYYQNTDGSTTVVLGYTSTYPTTQTIPVGSRNYMTPSTYSAGLPTVFQPGTNDGAATMRIAAADLYSTSWTLDGTTLSYWSTSGATICTQAQLPAFANGAALAGAVLVAGVAGALVVRRVRRNLSSASSSNRSAPGGHRA